MLEKASGISGAPRKFSILYFNLSAGSGPFGGHWRFFLRFFSKPSKPTELQNQKPIENS